VQTVKEIFQAENELEEFVMCWNRRIAQSQLFFDMMNMAGFCMNNHGRGVYTFTFQKDCNVSTS
jgi:hypothetical protein